MRRLSNHGPILLMLQENGSTTAIRLKDINTVNTGASNGKWYIEIWTTGDDKWVLNYVERKDVELDFQNLLYQWVKSQGGRDEDNHT